MIERFIIEIDYPEDIMGRKIPAWKMCAILDSLLRKSYGKRVGLLDGSTHYIRAFGPIENAAAELARACREQGEELVQEHSEREHGGWE